MALPVRSPALFRRLGLAFERLQVFLGLDIARQVNAEGGAHADLAVDDDRAARLLHDAVDRGKAEARALAHLLGREERIEDFLKMLGLDAGAGVAHLAEHIFAAGKPPVLQRQQFALAHIRGADRDLAAVGHRVARVHREVHDHLENLALVGLHEPQVAAVLDAWP